MSEEKFIEICKECDREKRLADKAYSYWKRVIEIAHNSDNIENSITKLTELVEDWEEKHT